MSFCVSKIVNLSPNVLNFLTPEPLEDESIKEYSTLGGILTSANYAWLANGPNLEIIKTNNGSKIGAWSFNLIDNAEIICVEEIQKNNKRPPWLAVVLDCGNQGSMICIFDFIISKVIRAIEVEENITSLHVVNPGNDIFTLPSPLRAFDGIFAIGTAGGPVYLIDIGLQILDDGLTLKSLVNVRDEFNSCKLIKITLNEIDKIESYKESAVRNNDHLAIYLNAALDNKTKHFLLKGPNGEHHTYVDAKEAAVSSLFYCSQLGSLLVGYNFGAFQLYNLVDLKLIYTSKICEEHIPITHFTIQEPADDPEAYCYIWAVYNAGRDLQACFPLAVMYVFRYHTKEYHEGYGYLYQDFKYASIQFQMDLNPCNDENRRQKPQGGRCLSLNTIQRSNFVRDAPYHDTTDDNLSLSIFVWNVMYNKRDSDTCVCIFDLNQWYKEQLPSIPDPNFSSTYMIQFCISNLYNSSVNQDHSTLDVNIIAKSLKQFKGAQKLEEYFCPNSLSYDLCTLREDSVIFLQSKGVQESLLAHIESSGPLCLIEPADIYQQIIGLGLLPLLIDLPSNVPVSTNQQREIILSTALEYHLRGWLCKCASEWASGNFLSSGCSLDFLISWAFQRALILKTNCDKFCVPLFDYSQTKLDSNTANLLDNCTEQLRNLTSFYIFIIEKLFRFLSNPELAEEQYRSLESTVVYFEVLQWLLNIGLLPECPVSSYPQADDFQRVNIPYPTEMLIDFYNQRRGLLKIENEKQFSSTQSPLFIDNLIDKEYGGEILQGHWRNDGGNGLYPPPSIQALLRTYLIDNADIVFKHTIVSYVFLDLVMVLEQDRYKPLVAYLIKFPTIFKLSLSKIKIIQAFWQLDHGDCNTAISLLLDPLVMSGDLIEWHHKIVLRLLILQNQHKLALLYLQVRKPIMKDNQDICAIISLYVSNNMLDEAFYFERCYGGQSDNKFLLHLFDEAERHGKLKSIIHRNLSKEQEALFLNYLAKSPKPYAKDLQIYYYILRSRYIEAFNFYDNNLSKQVECQGLYGQLHANPRDQLIPNLKQLLPDINQNLLNFHYKNKDYNLQNVSSPTPMSVFVHNTEENVRYKSNVIGAAMTKARQTFKETLIDRKFVTEATPFLRNSIFNRTTQRDVSIIIDPYVMKMDDTIDESAAPPNKRMRLSSKSNQSISLSTSTLQTPIVKRKITRTPVTSDNMKLPQSILKKLPRSEPIIKRKDDREFFEKLNTTPVSIRKSNITPRKSLERPSPSVRFEGLKSSSSDSIDNNSSKESRESSKSQASDEFYSPDVSFEEQDRNQRIEINDEELKQKLTPFSLKSRKGLPSRSSSKLSSKKSLDFTITEDTPEKDTTTNKDDSREKSPKILTPRKSLHSDDNNSTGQVQNTTPNIEDSPRRSQRLSSTKISLELNDLPTDVSPIRSPRRSLKFDNSSNLTVDNGKKSESPQGSPKILPNLRPRKSLHRQVLENNTASRVLASPRRRLSKRIEKEETSESIEKIQETHIESSLKFDDGEQLQKSSLIEKHSVSTKTLIEETDEDDISIDASDLNKAAIDLELSKSMVDDSSKLDVTNISQDSIIAEKSENPLEIRPEIAEPSVIIENKQVEVTEHLDSTIEKPSESVLKSNETIEIKSRIEEPSVIIENKETEYRDSTIEMSSRSVLTANEIIEISSRITESSIIIENQEIEEAEHCESTIKKPSESEIVSDNNQTTSNSEIITIDETLKESTSHKSDVELMEVDADVVNEKSVNDADDDDDVKLIYDDLSQSSQAKETDEDLSRTNEINIYELTDDNNEGIEVEQVVLEEDNDLRSALMEENEFGESPSVLERNIFDEDLSEDDNDRTIAKKDTEPEIIEISSSSEKDNAEDDDEEDEEDSEEVSIDSSSVDENEEIGVVYVRNLNQSSFDDSESSEKSEISEIHTDDDDDDIEINEEISRDKGGLFSVTIQAQDEEQEQEVHSEEQDSSIDEKDRDFDYKKRQSEGLFHGPIVDLDETEKGPNVLPSVDETSTKTQAEEQDFKTNETEVIEINESTSKQETVKLFDSLKETESEGKDTNLSKALAIDATTDKQVEPEKQDEVNLEETEKISKSEEGDTKAVVSPSTSVTTNSRVAANEAKAVEINETTCTEGTTKPINPLETTESQNKDTFAIEKQDSFQNDCNKRQSRGLFHGPIIDTTTDVHEPEKESSVQHKPAEKCEDDQSVNLKETEKTSKSEESNISTIDLPSTSTNQTSTEEQEELKTPSTKVVEQDETMHVEEVENNQEMDYKRRQSYGLFHGDIIGKDETQRDSSNLEFSKIEDKSIDASREIDYKKRQSYGLFHGSILDETTITEEKDCLTKLDISVIEHRALDEIKHQITSEIGCEQIDESTEKNKEIDMIDLPSTSQIIDLPSTSRIDYDDSTIRRQRTRRRAVSEDVEQVSLRRSTRRRSSSFHSEGHQESTDLDNTSVSKSLRSRTIKFDESGSKSTSRQQRKTSVEDDAEVQNNTTKPQKKSVKRRASVSQLPEIIEEEDDESHRKRIKETLEDYSKSRRITRRQATLLQRIDPVVVLDKLPTDETSKQTEESERAPSPSLSDSPSSKKKPKRRLRADSQNSNTSLQSDSKVSSTTGTKMRLRSSSTDAPSDTSEKSVNITRQNKKTKSSQKSSPESEQVPRTRSRTNSESSNASSVSLRSSKSKLTTNQLPDIKEEDSVEESKPVKRVTRKRSSQK